MFERVTALVDELRALEADLADPSLHSDPARARAVGKRHAQLRPVVETYERWVTLGEDEQAARELAEADATFAQEAEDLAAQRAQVADDLSELLVPRDPLDDSDAIVEIKAGEGGDESALFAGDLLRMYERYASIRGWRMEVIDLEETNLGGVKDATISIKAKGQTEVDDMPFARLKWEAGVHRVQRVPVTESQGRIHTSAAGVLVFPETEDIEITIDPNDLRIDVYRSSGPGGQSVNTTDSAVRITHVPTGVVVSCQNEKSQLQNKEQAMRILRARLVAIAEEEKAAEASATRKEQVRTVDRSERIRTYNFPENRISDHRTGFKAYNLDHVLAGELDPVIQSCLDADLATRLESAESL
ncbi:MAG: peptide chain release factor 1 [Actinobacteria bacterium]|nr:peptide chain release factor 1 [Actinomycetota bacterium]MCB8996557.1 peptide chain release factor 1 [Actinomycetota bacterium]HRY08573.1 peptide chain release factor 1 [Candidatus Nanopelagicales bacterium]